MSTRFLRSLALVCCLALIGCSDSTESNNVVPNNTNNANSANNTNNLNNANNSNNLNNANNTNNANNGEIDLTVEALETGGYGVLLQKSSDESGLRAIVMDFENGVVLYETPPQFAVATADVSADGSRLAFTGNNGEDPAQVYTVDLPDGDPQPIGIPGDGELLRGLLLDMSEDGSRLVYICLGFGIESTCMWDEGQVSDLDPNEEFSGASVAELTPDGSTAVFRAGDIIYRADLDDGAWTELYDFDNPPMAGYPSDSAQGDVSISDDGEVIAFGGNDETGEDVLRAITVIGPGSEMGVVHDPVELSPRGAGVAISPDGTSVAFNNSGMLKWFDVGAEDTVNTLDGEPLNSPYFINNDAIVYYDVENDTDNWEVVYSEFGEEPITIASGPRGGEDVLADIFQMSQ